MTDLLTRTACGLYVIGDGKPRGWPNFTWVQPVADMPGDQEDLDALALIGKELMGQVGQATASGQYVAPIDLAFACLHAGEVERVEHVDLDFADPDVPGELVDADTGSDRYTVCGLLEDSWRTVRYVAMADNPRVAYFRAWEWCRDQLGGYLLLAAVHVGAQPALEVFGYADPWAKDDEAMRAKANDWGLS